MTIPFPAATSQMQQTSAWDALVADYFDPRTASAGDRVDYRDDTDDTDDAVWAEAEAILADRGLRLDDAGGGYVVREVWAMAATTTRWEYSVRRVDLPAGSYEPSPARATFATLAEAQVAAAEYAADDAGCYTPRIYEVRTRGRRVVCTVRVARSREIAA